MDQQRFRFSGAPGLNLPRADADRLLALADGTCALLYIYLLRHDGVLEPGEAARAMCRTERELLAAAERLCTLGLLEPAETARKGPAPAEELPEYTSEEISRRTGEDPAFQGLVAEAQRLMGRLLSGTDLRILFGIYDHLGLPPEVVLLLINHCAETARERHGEGRAPTLRAIEKEAYIWANREILTLEQAEAHLRRLAQRRDGTARLKGLLQIHDRALSPTERAYTEAWLDMGFTPEALAIAYDRTVVKTGRLHWKYMDSIVRSWHGKGLHSPAEIEAGDGRGRPAAGAGSADTPLDRSEIERMEKMLNKVKSGG